MTSRYFLARRMIQKASNGHKGGIIPEKIVQSEGQGLFIVAVAAKRLTHEVVEVVLE